jgi:hypothetical protein
MCQIQRYCQGVVRVEGAIFFEILPGGGKGGRCMVQIFFWNLTHFFDFEFKNTSNLIFLGFKVPFERFFHKDFKTGLTF